MKNYFEWHKKKQWLENKNIPFDFSERDIWWCNIGLNIGDEEDGKNSEFERPVYVLKKFNRTLFFGLPLSSTQKEKLFYFPITIEGQAGSILLSQGRIFSAKRLQRKMIRIGRGKSKLIRRNFINLLL